MAVKIRLKRMGAKKAPFYRIVVTDSRSPRDGKFIEEIGYFNPISEPNELKVDNEKAIDWMSKGAQPSDTVRALLKKSGAIQQAWVFKMSELIKYIVSHIVEHPEEIEITEVENGDTIHLKLKVAESDVGKVIGRQGKIAKAIRAILKSSCSKAKTKYVLDII